MGPLALHCDVNNSTVPLSWGTGSAHEPAPQGNLEGLEICSPAIHCAVNGGTVSHSWGAGSAHEPAPQSNPEGLEIGPLTLHPAINNDPRSHSWRQAQLMSLHRRVTRRA